MDILLKLFTPLRGRKSSPKTATAEPAPRPVERRERRVSDRHLVHAKGTLCSGVSGMPEDVDIRDCSGQGIFLFSNFPLGIRSQVDIYMTLPPELSGNGVRRVHYSASVVRAERQPGGGYGIAAVLKRCEPIPEAAADPEPPKRQPRRAKTGRRLAQKGARAGKRELVSEQAGVGRR